MRSPVSSETRSPVWAVERQQGMVTASVPGPAAAAAAMSASSSSWARKQTMVVSVRLAGMASTRAISAACSGARSDAYRNSARIAVSRALRVAALLPRSSSRWVRNAPMSAASRSPRSS